MGHAPPLVAVVVLAVLAAGCSDTGDRNVFGERETADTTRTPGPLEAMVPVGDSSHDHVQGPIDYTGTPYQLARKAPPAPPLGGRHNPKWLRCGVYDVPVPNEYAVHSLEHGAVWLAYRPDLPADQVRQLAALSEISDTTREYVLVSPYEGIPAPVVAVMWGRWLPARSADDPALRFFVETLVRSPDGGEHSAPCRTDGLTPEQAEQELAGPYPPLSSAPKRRRTSGIPEEVAVEGITVTKVGHALDEAHGTRYVHAVAVIVNNANVPSALKAIFTVYGAKGEMLNQSEASGPTAQAGGTVVVTLPLALPPGASGVERVEATVLGAATRFGELPESTWYTASEATFTGRDENTGSVSGQISSALPRSFANVYVAAACMDKAGEIIGGGDVHLDVPAAGGTVPVEVDVTVRGAPAQCALYPTLGHVSQRKD